MIRTVSLIVWTLMCSTTLNSCDWDDDTLIANPALVSRIRAMQKEPVTFSISNISKGTDIILDFGDGSEQYKGKAGDVISHSYTNTETDGYWQDYVVKAWAGDLQFEKRIRIYHLLSLTEAMKQWENGSKNVWIMAHRSHTADGSIPENSVSAVAAAIKSGANVIECDTQITADGVVVVCHDQTIDATTDGTGDITQMTLDQIREYNMTDRNGNVTSEKIPTLEEFLKAGRGKIYFNLDYSPRSASTEQVMTIVQSLDMMESVLFYCNTKQKAEECLDLYAGTNVYCWYNQYTDSMTTSEKKYFIQMGCDESMASNVSNSLRIGLLSTVNMLHVNDAAIPEFSLDETLAARIADTEGVRMIQTDVPELLEAFLKNRGLR